MTPANQTIKTGFFKRHQWRLALNGTLILIAGALAWRYYDSRYPSWYEEVRLSDGRIITIHQKREYYENYGTSQSWVTIDLPELGGKRIWHSYLVPMRVDIVDGNLYVFGKPRGPRQISYYRYPQNHMVAFKWQNAEFQRIPFLSLPTSLREAENVYPCLPTKPHQKLTVANKDDQWCPASGDKSQFVKQINLSEYQKLAIQFAKLDGGRPISE